VSTVSFSPGEDILVDKGVLLSLGLSLSDDLPSDLNVTIASSNNSVVRVVNPSLVIPRGSRAGGYDLEAVGSGSTTITLTSDLGMSDNFAVSVP
jgi:hypothetical protein